MSTEQPSNVNGSNRNWRNRTGRLFKDAGTLTARTMKIPKAFFPLTHMLSTEEDVTVQQLSKVLDQVFVALYEHPITQHTQRLTDYLRRNKYIPNEESTENLIRFVINQSIMRSPVPVPEAVVNEFWNFFQELFSEPELKGLVELNLDISRLVLKTYEPLLADLINLIKHARRVNQHMINEIIGRVQVIRSDLLIIRRQIKALRYIKPFFQCEPRDFRSQAQIVAQMVREFGPFFIKMAQVAAANADFLPEEISKELAVFQQDVPPMNANEVLEAFQECFGMSPYERYFGFDAEKPIRSGSIGSVYLAKRPVLEDGNEVLQPIVIKVGRHNLDREFLMGKMVLGLAILSSHYWAPHSKLAPFLQAMVQQVDEFSKGFLQELDFGLEAELQTRFAQRSRESTVWQVPEVYNTSRRILEMEFLEDTVSLNKVPQVFSRTHGLKFQRNTAHQLLYTFLMQCFIYNEFHGDLHPGNILVGPKGELYLIDWGNVVNMEGKWKPVWDYVKAVLLADIEKLTQALINLSTDPALHRERADEIRQMLSETLRKKNIATITQQNYMKLFEEGIEGLHRRAQTIMQLMSNTQQLGMVMRSEYMHLSRSLYAFVGSYGGMFEGMPKYVMVIDALRTMTQFPMALMKDRFEIKRKNLRGQLKKRAEVSAVLRLI